MQVKFNIWVSSRPLQLIAKAYPEKKSVSARRKKRKHGQLRWIAGSGSREGEGGRREEGGERREEGRGRGRKEADEGDFT